MGRLSEPRRTSPSGLLCLQYNREGRRGRRPRTRSVRPTKLNGIGHFAYRVATHRDTCSHAFNIAGTSPLAVWVLQILRIVDAKFAILVRGSYAGQLMFIFDHVVIDR